MHLIQVGSLGANDDCGIHHCRYSHRTDRPVSLPFRPPYTTLDREKIKEKRLHAFSLMHLCFSIVQFWFSTVFSMHKPKCSYCCSSPMVVPVSEK